MSSTVLELRVAIRSGAEISRDFRAIFVPVDGSQSHEEICQHIKKTKCASDWVVSIRKVHHLNGGHTRNLIDFFRERLPSPKQQL